MKTYAQRQEEIAREKAHPAAQVTPPRFGQPPKQVSGIRILPSGIAVIEGDTHISKWVEQHRRLDIERTELEEIHAYVPEGGVVVDVGAMIGDQTVVYAEFVGPKGRVFAFEPNADAAAALRHNTKALPQVSRFSIALGAETNKLLKFDLSANAGASFLRNPDATSGDYVLSTTLDYVLSSAGAPKVDFLKVDAEGFELEIFAGAKDVISASRPVLYFEINHGALKRNGHTFEDVKRFLAENKYSYTSTDKRVTFRDFDTFPQYNMLAIPQ